MRVLCEDLVESVEFAARENFGDEEDRCFSHALPGFDDAGNLSSGVAAHGKPGRWKAQQFPLETHGLAAY